MNLPKSPFLTLPDPEVAIKGSRDPLGFEVLWTGLGRRVVTNLTSVTTSVRGFTTFLLGYYFASHLIERGMAEDQFIKAFLKFEQIAAYSRFAWNPNLLGTDDVIRGAIRVVQNLRSGKGKVTISSQNTYQILSDQRMYGLWGLYSVASRNSGLINTEKQVLTSESLDFVENYILPQIDKNNSAQKLILDIMNREKYSYMPGKNGEHEVLGKLINHLHEPTYTKREKEFYAQHLLFGNKGEESFQARFWKYLTGFISDNSQLWRSQLSLLEIKGVIEVNNDNNDDLTQRLEDIINVDRLMIVCNNIFLFLLGRHGSSLKNVINDISEQMGANQIINSDYIRDIKTTIASIIGNDSTDNLLLCGDRINSGDYREAVDILINYNNEVMKGRGGSAWVVVKEGTLDIRYKDEDADLDDVPVLMNSLYSTFFLDSVKRIGRSLYGL